MPSVQRVHEALQPQGVVVLAISIDGAGVQAVQPVITKHGYTFSTLVDSQMEVARAFGVRGVPTTYVIDRQGAVVASGFGPIDFDSPSFRAYVQALVAQPPG